MTNEEAISMLHTIVFLIDDKYNTDEPEEALEMAQKAILRDIPKAVCFSGDKSLALCPVCGHEMSENGAKWDAEYCINCGQKLNWEVEL